MGEEALVRRSILDRIFHEMMNIRYRLDDIEKRVGGWSPQPVGVVESELLALPDHLRMTYTTVAAKGECDATVVSKFTGRCRSVESNYLNQLSRMGWLNRRRISKTIHFRLVSENVPGKATAVSGGKTRMLGPRKDGSGIINSAPKVTLLRDRSLL